MNQQKIVSGFGTILVIAGIGVLAFVTIIGLFIQKQMTNKQVNEESKTRVVQMAPTISQKIPSPKTTQPIRASDTTDAKLDTDLTTIDTSINAINTDATSIDAGLNDQMGDLSE